MLQTAALKFNQNGLNAVCFKMTFNMILSSFWKEEKLFVAKLVQFCYL